MAGKTLLHVFREADVVLSWVAQTAEDIHVVHGRLMVRLRLVDDTGLEPVTSSMSRKRSSQLS